MLLAAKSNCYIFNTAGLLYTWFLLDCLHFLHCLNGVSNFMVSADFEVSETLSLYRCTLTLIYLHMNISMYANSITVTTTAKNIMCHLSPVTCHLSPTSSATATDPPPANSPAMHSSLVDPDRTKKSRAKFKTKTIIEIFPKMGFVV